MHTQIRRRIVVRGRVQGVWFRASTEEAATAVGATGWVRNRSDGSVEIEVQGSPETVEAVMAFARVGPDRARVEETRIDDLAVVPGETGFVTAR